MNPLPIVIVFTLLGAVIVVVAVVLIHRRRMSRQRKLEHGESAGSIRPIRKLAVRRGKVISAGASRRTSMSVSIRHLPWPTSIYSTYKFKGSLDDGLPASSKDKSTGLSSDTTVRDIERQLPPMAERDRLDPASTRFLEPPKQVWTGTGRRGYDQLIGVERPSMISDRAISDSLMKAYEGSPDLLTHIQENLRPQRRSGPQLLRPSSRQMIRDATADLTGSAATKPPPPTSLSTSLVHDHPAAENSTKDGTLEGRTSRPEHTTTTDAANAASALGRPYSVVEEKATGEDNGLEPVLPPVLKSMWTVESTADYLNLQLRPTAAHPTPHTVLDHISGNRRLHSSIAPFPPPVPKLPASLLAEGATRRRSRDTKGPSRLHQDRSRRDVRHTSGTQRLRKTLPKIQTDHSDPPSSNPRDTQYSFLHSPSASDSTSPDKRSRRAVVSGASALTFASSDLSPTFSAGEAHQISITSQAQRRSLAPRLMALSNVPTKHIVQAAAAAAAPVPAAHQVAVPPLQAHGSGAGHGTRYPYDSDSSNQNSIRQPASAISRSTTMQSNSSRSYRSFIVSPMSSHFPR